MRIKNLRPSPGVLIATIALVFALTGAAVAATKVQTNNIANKAVTGAKLAKDSVKSAKIVDGKVKAQDLAPGVVPQQAYGRVNKSGATVTPGAGAVGITGVASGGAGVICYDLAFAPVSGTGTVAGDAPAQPGATVELVISPTAGCAAPFNDAATLTKLASGTNPATDKDVYVEFIR